MVVPGCGHSKGNFTADGSWERDRVTMDSWEGVN